MGIGGLTAEAMGKYLSRPLAWPKRLSKWRNELSTNSMIRRSNACWRDCWRLPTPALRKPKLVIARALSADEPRSLTQVQRRSGGGK